MHGGDIYRNHVRLDFSVNINPLGIPEEIAEAMHQGIDRAGVYPDMHYDELRHRLAAQFAWKENRILCGNGASELIMAICRWRKPKSALLLAPGFSGYERALAATKCKIKYYELQPGSNFAVTEELLQIVSKKRPDLLFLSNPSNPTGVAVEKGFMRKLALLCERTHTTLVIDECFVELTKEPTKWSLAGHMDLFKELLILRAFTKSFAMPGLRLGYLLCGDEVDVEGIALQLPEWNVSVPAQFAGVEALGMSRFLKKSARYIASEREFLSQELEKLGAIVFPSQANYILFQWKDEYLYERLLERGILIRDCSDYNGLSSCYYRVAVKRHEQNLELLSALRMDDLTYFVKKN